MNYLLASLAVIPQPITLLAMVIGSRSGGCDGGTKKVILSLVLDTFGLGMAKFGVMGVLAELTHNVGISIPVAGHVISYYALGVVVGTPIIALFSSRHSLEYILLFLVTLCVTGSTTFTFPSSYLMLATGRLVSDFPYGAFFSIGVIVLLKTIKPGKVIAAVAGIVSGVIVTNLLGVPLGTYLNQEFSWRHTLLLIAVFNVAVMALVYSWVPDTRDETKGKLREQFHFLRSPTSWLVFAATMFGNAGVFAWFSYVKPYMMFISGSPETAMTFITMLVGLGMVLKGVLSGRVPGCYSPLRIVTVVGFIIVLILLMLFLFGGMETTSPIFTFIYRVGLSVLSAPLQILLL